MATVEYLDDERTKLWAAVNSLKQKIDDAVTKLSQVDKASAETARTQLELLDGKIEEVRKLAASKTPEDVQTASRAAQEAVQSKELVVNLAIETQAAAERLINARQGLEKLQQTGEAAAAIRQELEETQARIAAIKAGVESGAAALKETVARCEGYETDLGASSKAASANAQNVLALNKQAEDAASTLEASKKTFSSLKTELEEAKSNFETMMSDSKASMESLHANSKETFDALIGEKKQKLDDLTAEIEKLLPPASTASISKSFEDRKNAVLKGKWIWALLLIAAVAAIVAFGCMSLWYPASHDGPMTIFTRFVIISGLAILEEFARRNYSAVFRLAEAYAYKEAICKSLVGFKKELGGISLPKRSESDDGERADAELAATFLSKIGDEPAGRVFEKNRPVFGLLQACLRLANPPSGEEMKTETIANIANGIGRFSWQIVVAIGIISVSILAGMALIIR